MTGSPRVDPPLVARSCKGVISLKGVTAVNGPGYCEWTMPNLPKQAIPNVRFEVVLPDRTYYFYAETAADAEAWARKIQQAVKVGPQTMPLGPRAAEEVMSGQGFQAMIAQMEGSVCD